MLHVAIDKINVVLINIYVVFINIYIDIASIYVSHEKKKPDLQTGKVSFRKNNLYVLKYEKVCFLSNIDTLAVDRKSVV